MAERIPPGHHAPMKSDLFSSEHLVQPAAQAGMTVENSKCVRYTVNGEMLARQGAMIAYRGNLQFERKGQGVGGMLKRAVTGEGLPLMTVRGQGEAWFAHEAQNCFVVDVEQGDEFTVNGRNVLCFDATLAYRIATVKGAGIAGGGLFNSVFTGQGRLGLVCEETRWSSRSPSSTRYTSTRTRSSAGRRAWRPRCTVRSPWARCCAAVRARRCNWCCGARATSSYGRVRRPRRRPSSTEVIYASRATPRTVSTS